MIYNLQLNSSVVNNDRLHKPHHYFRLSGRDRKNLSRVLIKLARRRGLRQMADPVTSYRIWAASAKLLLAVSIHRTAGTRSLKTTPAHSSGREESMVYSRSRFLELILWLWGTFWGRSVQTDRLYADRPPGSACCVKEHKKMPHQYSLRVLPFEKICCDFCGLGITWVLKVNI